MVIRSIGYKSQRINEDIGWDESQQTIGNSNGCILDNEGKIIKG